MSFTDRTTCEVPRNRTRGQDRNWSRNHELADEHVPTAFLYLRSVDPVAQVPGGTGSTIGIVRDEEHSDGAPTIEGTGIRVQDVADAYEHSGYDPDEITQLYPDLSLSDVHRALAYYYDHVDDFRSTSPESASA